MSILIAGASGAAAAAVAMMAGAYLEVETTRDSALKRRTQARIETVGDTSAILASLPDKLRAAGLDPAAIGLSFGW